MCLQYIKNPNPETMHLRIGNTVITKKPKTNTYEIRNDVCPHLMKSVAAAIGTSTSTSTINKTKTTSVEARDVMTLKEYLQRSSHVTELYAALCLLRDLGRQMQALLSGGHGIACFSVDDVVVIAHRESDAFTHNDPESTLGADPQFLFLNDRLIFEVDESDGALLIDRALNANTKNAFVAPELAAKQEQEQEQERVHFKTAYHSAAQLLIYFLLGKSESDRKSESDSKQGIIRDGTSLKQGIIRDGTSLKQGIIRDGTSLNGTSLNGTSLNLNPIKGTKLYWFLQRCLNRVPSDRSYVYV